MSKCQHSRDSNSLMILAECSVSSSFFFKSVFLLLYPISLLGWAKCLLFAVLFSWVVSSSAHSQCSSTVLKRTLLTNLAEMKTCRNFSVYPSCGCMTCHTVRGLLHNWCSLTVHGRRNGPPTDHL